MQTRFHSSETLRKASRTMSASSSFSPFGPLIGAIDQGTSSTRIIIFSAETAAIITQDQIHFDSIYPFEGWCEQDPMMILDTVLKCIEKVAENLKEMNINPRDIRAFGISNQRETTIMWDKLTGKPLCNAIVWLDTRTSSIVEEFITKDAETEDLLPQTKDRLQVRVLSSFVQRRCGLPLSTYFSAVKINWLMHNDYNVEKAVEDDRCLFGTVDSWLLWNLTGGVNGGVHCTDVTNASRTMLMNLKTLSWDPELCNFFSIPLEILPEIRSSSEIYGRISSGTLKGVPISGCLGDQSAALVGQLCFQSGMAKNTYGTGCFMLYNTGPDPIFSKNGLLTTVAYQLGKQSPVCYALEGSIAIAGACMDWLKRMEIIHNTKEIDELCNTVEHTHGVYFVPAFSGLFAPYWESTARGLIIGLTQYTRRAHLVRAALEAVCFQTREILDAMGKDSQIPLKSLQVDGGMCNNDTLLQLQTDLIGIPVVRPAMLETTALGAAMAAGSAEGIGVWDLESEHLAAAARTYLPQITEIERKVRCERWTKAVYRCMHWEES